MKKSCKDILDFMRIHGTITPRQASRLGCERLSARIWDLKHDGYIIVTDRKTVTKRDGRKTSIACYRLVKEASNV